MLAYFLSTREFLEHDKTLLWNVKYRENQWLSLATGLYVMLSEFFIPRANLIKFCLAATKSCVYIVFVDRSIIEEMQELLAVRGGNIINVAWQSTVKGWWQLARGMITLFEIGFPVDRVGRNWLDIKRCRIIISFPDTCDKDPRISFVRIISYSRWICYHASTRK